MAVSVEIIDSREITFTTAEAVGEGHPDKSADVISGAVVGEHLLHDPFAHIAAETLLASNGSITLAGEITSGHMMDPLQYRQLVHRSLRAMGWNHELGYNPDALEIRVDYSHQSQDIAQGIEQGRAIGAGDQGMNVGFAVRTDRRTAERDDRMPLPISLSKALLFAIDQHRREHVSHLLKPDMKSQVDVLYGPDGQPLRATNLVFALSHTEEIDRDGIRGLILPVVAPVFEQYGVEYDLRDAIINGTDRFVVAGAPGDTGLTGRKLVVDAYGPDIPIGGGAFHGKDPTKVDVSGAYAARWLANQIVGNEMADQCLVTFNWCIGRPEPFVVRVNLGGTERVSKQQIINAVGRVDLSVATIIEKFGMRRLPQSGILYDRLAAWGPFGNLPDGSARPWETVVEPHQWDSWQVGSGS